MKRTLIGLLVLCFAGILSAQTLQGNYDVSRYVANDTTTFYLGIPKDTKLIYVDYTDLDADDAEMQLGAAGNDLLGWGRLSLTVESTAVDSVILDATNNAATAKNSSGTRSTTSRTYIWFPDGIPSNFLAVTFLWNSVTTGRIKIYF